MYHKIITNWNNITKIHLYDKPIILTSKRTLKEYPLKIKIEYINIIKKNLWVAQDVVTIKQIHSNCGYIRVLGL